MCDAAEALLTTHEKHFDALSEKMRKGAASDAEQQEAIALVADGVCALMKQSVAVDAALRKIPDVVGDAVVVAITQHFETCREKHRAKTWWESIDQKWRTVIFMLIGAAILIIALAVASAAKTEVGWVVELIKAAGG